MQELAVRRIRNGLFGSLHLPEPGWRDAGCTFGCLLLASGQALGVQKAPRGQALGERPNRLFLLGQARSVQLFTRLMMY